MYLMWFYDRDMQSAFVKTVTNILFLHNIAYYFWVLTYLYTTDCTIIQTIYVMYVWRNNGGVLVQSFL